MESQEFIDTFNEYYPFERYIVKSPKSINYLFDDVKLIEVFVPSTEIKPITYINRVTGKERHLAYTEIDHDEVYVKLVCKGVKFRMALYDFNSGIQESIIATVIEDMCDLNWQSLFTDFDDEEDEALTDLAVMLKEQKTLITEKYGECNIKDNFIIEDTINLLKQIGVKEG